MPSDRHAADTAIAHQAGGRRSSGCAGSVVGMREDRPAGGVARVEASVEDALHGALKTWLLAEVALREARDLLAAVAAGEGDGVSLERAAGDWLKRYGR